MPWNGSGGFVRKHNWTQEAAAGIAMLPDRFDDDTNDITAAGLGNCITRDGQGVPTANVPFGGFRITVLGTPLAAGDGANKGYVDTANSNRSMGGYRYTNLADPVDPQDAATKAWVGGTTTALPDQTNNAGKFLFTNGATASWSVAAGNSLYLFNNCGGF
jgi:hypothetical protein